MLIETSKCCIKNCLQGRLVEDRFFCTIHRENWVRFLNQNNLNREYDPVVITEQKILEALIYFKNYYEK